MNLEEKRISSEYKFKGKIINLRLDDALLPNGETAKREIVEHNGGVCVVPLTDKNEVLMVRQFRYPYMEIIKEIPAGKRDGNEEPLACGIRELKEETGCTADSFIFLGELYPTPGYCGEIIYMFLAKGLSYGETDPDDDEFLEIEKIPIDDLINEIMNGNIKDAKTQTAVLKVKRLIDEGKI